MPFSCLCATANCGNSGLGALAAESMILQLRDMDADFYIINAQEVNVNTIRSELNAALSFFGVADQYNVTQLNFAVTRTKPDQILSQSTGLATFMISKVELRISDIVREKAMRRNKGAILSKLKIMHQDETQESITIQTISAHLDSFSSALRHKDWLIILKAMRKAQVTDWESLVNSISDVYLLGYDANTRNIIIDGPQGQKEVSAWHMPEDPGIIGIAKTQFTNLYSTDITYSKSSSSRPGPSRGMLDLCGVQGSDDPYQSSVIIEGVCVYDIEQNSKRDHSIVTTPLCRHSPKTPFEIVKGHLAMSLGRAAPRLSEEISQLEDTPESKEICVKIYHELLSRDGLMHVVLDVHINNLNTKKPTVKKHDLWNRIERLDLESIRNNTVALIQAQVTETLSDTTRSWWDLFRSSFNTRAASTPTLLSTGEASALETPIQGSESYTEDHQTDPAGSSRLIKQMSFSEVPMEFIENDPILLGEKCALYDALDKFLSKNKMAQSEIVKTVRQLHKQLESSTETTNVLTEEQWNQLASHPYLRGIMKAISPELKCEITDFASSSSDEEDDDDFNISASGPVKLIRQGSSTCSSYGQFFQPPSHVLQNLYMFLDSSHDDKESLCQTLQEELDRCDPEESNEYHAAITQLMVVLNSASAVTPTLSMEEWDCLSNTPGPFLEIYEHFKEILKPLIPLEPSQESKPK